MPFISVEGIDGSGKTEQVGLLIERLMREGKTVVRTKEPDGGHLGGDVRSILTDRCRVLSPMEQLLLVSAARYDHVRSVVRPALDAGNWVVTDRFIDSTYAFQVVASEIDLGRVYDEVTAVVVGGTMPDITLVLCLPVEVARARRAARGRSDEDPAEALRDFQAISDALLSVARGNPRRCRVIDADQDRGSVARDVWQAVQPLL